jgi:hypothetical protein
MGLDAKHPEYIARREDWAMMRDFYAGERVVKSKTTNYLPATSGMTIDGMGRTTGGKKNIGQEAYDAYLVRALFPDYVKEAVEAYIGLLHQKAPTIRLPKVLEPLRERATLFGESLEMLIRRINEEQLVSGRMGLFLDLPFGTTDPTVMPYIATYIAESAGNWDADELGEGPAKLTLVVLDESTNKRNINFDWVPWSKYRVLELYRSVNEAGDPIGAPVYRFGVFTEEGNGTPAYVASEMKEALWKGTSLDQIPFVFVNSKDITPETDEPPIMGLARLCRAIYCGEADLRQNLFMQGQDTLVLAGERKKSADATIGDTSLRTGAGSMIEMEQGGTAQYVGVTANGLSEQRQTLQDDHQRAASRAGQLINTKANGVESGDALKTRVAAQTATLTLIALTSAAAVEAILKIAAKWAGADPEEVKVDPNLEFSDYDMTGDNLVKLMTARKEGAPISKESIHGLMADQGLTRMDFKTEMATIKKEDAEMPPPAPAPGTPGSQTTPEPKDPAAGNAPTPK